MKDRANYSRGRATGSGVVTLRLSNEAPSDSTAAPNSDAIVPCTDEDHDRPFAKSKGDVDAATKIAVGWPRGLSLRPAGRQAMRR